MQLFKLFQKQSNNQPLIDEVIWLLDDVEKQRRKMRRLMAAPAGMALFGLGLIVGSSIPDSLAVGGLLTGAGALGMSFCTLLRGLPLARLDEAWEKAGNVRHIGPLLEAEARSADLSGPCRRVLIRLLPQLGPKDHALLTAAQRRLLCEMLGRSVHMERLSGIYWSSDPEFEIVILKALEQVGDGDAIRYVAPIAQARAYTAVQERVREAAQNCLTALEAFADREKRSRTLLRAAVAPGDPPHEMLRPATHAVVSEEHLLLRSASWN